MPTPVTAASLLDAVDRDRAVLFATEITRLSPPDGREGPRARAIAELMEHPRLDIHVDPAMPGRPNVIVRLRGTGEAPGLLLNGHTDAGYVNDGWSHDPSIHGPRMGGSTVAPSATCSGASHR